MVHTGSWVVHTTISSEELKKNCSDLASFYHVLLKIYRTYYVKDCKNLGLNLYYTNILLC